MAEGNVLIHMEWNDFNSEMLALDIQGYLYEPEHCVDEFQYVEEEATKDVLNLCLLCDSIQYTFIIGPFQKSLGQNLLPSGASDFSRMLAALTSCL